MSTITPATEWRVGEWKITNFATGGPARETGAGRLWDEAPLGPLFVLVAPRAGAPGYDAAITGYCEACEAEGDGAETLIDYRTIKDPVDHSQDGECLRCGHAHATPYYDATESKGALARSVAAAIFPESFAPEFCRWCSNGERCPRSTRECPAQRASALDAGIPLDVIMGRKKLRDFFTEEQIDIACGRKTPEEALADAEQELRDAGRGHLVRR